MREIMDWMIAEKIAKNDFNAAAIVNGLELYKLADDDAMKSRCRLYRDWRNAGEKSKTAFAKAIAGEAILAEGAKPMFEGAMLSNISDLQDCPYCPNQGFTVECERRPIYDSDESGYPVLVAWHDDFIQVQCEFCWTNPLSKYNGTKEKVAE